MSYPENAEIAIYLLSEDEYKVAQDIYQVLEVPHTAQELLSAENTPTLSMAFPVYEMMVQTWKKYQELVPELQEFIGIGIQKIEEYLTHSRLSRAYALSMSRS